MLSEKEEKVLSLVKQDDSYSNYFFSKAKDLKWFYPLKERDFFDPSTIPFDENDNAKELVGDIPFKLVRFITQTRGSRDHWENTQENVFCMNSLIDFSRQYEKCLYSQPHYPKNQ